VPSALDIELQYVNLSATDAVEMGELNVTKVGSVHSVAAVVIYLIVLHLLFK
jgi:hypothetical protein